MRSKNRRFKFFHRFTTLGKTASGKPYLDRLYLLECPWFSIILQRIGGPDPEPDLHDHPWTFLSIILKGLYLERTPDDYIVRRRWNFKRAEDLHTIVETADGPVYTLLFCGPRRREWGFITKDGWVHFLEYLNRDE